MNDYKIIRIKLMAAKYKRSRVELSLDEYKKYDIINAMHGIDFRYTNFLMENRRNIVTIDFGACPIYI